jgi:hypothetical protein
MECLPKILKCKTKQGGMSQHGLAVYVKKYLKAKEGSMETQIFHHAKI